MYIMSSAVLHTSSRREILHERTGCVDMENMQERCNALPLKIPESDIYSETMDSKRVNDFRGVLSHPCY